MSRLSLPNVKSPGLISAATCSFNAKDIPARLADYFAASNKIELEGLHARRSGPFRFLGIAHFIEQIVDHAYL
jgi:hypothetical protein